MTNDEELEVKVLGTLGTVDSLLGGVDGRDGTPVPVPRKLVVLLTGNGYKGVELEVLVLKGDTSIPVPTALDELLVGYG